MGQDFHSERVIKSSRKLHVCEQCGRTIDTGLRCHKSSGVYCGDFYASYEHAECHAAGRAYAKISGCWGEEYMWFQHQLEEREDKLWLLDNHPIVAERLGLVREKVE